MKKFLSLVLALVMTMSLVTISAGAKGFTDGDKINYKEAIDVVSAVSIVDGYTDGSFNPQATLTRGAAAKIICNLMLGPTTAGALSADAAPYKDVPAGSTFAGYIAYCQKEGIISGYADGTFRPGNTLTGYAFMKMLLGALGYDSAIEGYTGNNWSINVAKRALSVGLDDGLLDDFNGTKAVTREEACLYAFNTLQADMVEYGDKTFVSVGDATVSVGGTAAKAVTWNNSATKKTNIKDDNYVQFAEQYFNKLVKAKTTDDFHQPATKWTNKGLKIGTYNETPDATYTENVKTGTIYADLNMNQKDEVAEVYINGETATSVSVEKNNERKIASDYANKDLVGDGSIVNVYYDDDNNQVTICVIDVFVGEISNVDKKAAEPYVNVAPKGTVKNIAGENVTVKAKYETDDAFTEDDVVLFTYSVKAGEIKSVKMAESVEGNLTKYTTGKSLTLGDTTYKYSKNIENTDVMSTKNDYVVYLDENGLVIFVDEKEFNASDYAYVMDVEYSGDTGFKYDRAKLLTSEGKLLTVNVDDDYRNLKNVIVTYRKDANNQYVLRKAANFDQNATTIATNANDTVTYANGGMLTGGVNDFVMKNTNATVTMTMTNNVKKYANSETVFVIMETAQSDNKTSYSVYTGIKNAPNISGGTVEAAWTLRGNVLGIVFIDATGANVSNATKDVLFLAGKHGASKLVVDSDNNQYYEFNAVNGDGEITTVKVDADTANVSTSANGAFTNVKTNSKNIITAVDLADNSDTYEEINENGIWKLSGKYTIGLGADKDRYTVATDAKMYRIDTDGNITKIASVDDIYSDSTAEVKVLLNETDGDLDYIFIQEINTNPDNGSGAVVTAGTVSNLTYSAGDVTFNATKAGKYTVKVEVLTSNGYVTMQTYTVTVNADNGQGKVTVGTLANNARITCGSEVIAAN